MRIRSIRNTAAGEITSTEPKAPESTPVRRTALTEVEAAQYIGMSAAWLKKSRTKRFREVIDAPPFIRAGAKRVVYRIEDLDAWQEGHLEHVGPSNQVETETVGGETAA